ncbi:MAG: Ig-like domain-containing protein [Corynebacterium sp.]|uniref:Ig-like domain-containing protein n=1 Tax=Corynebacterium sp. TaxID=1720 RepID=UPI0026DD2821|nr:Ig-like domain-containing protein [Corynebacterium sp.]MDO4760545.1 Ig-like domain-containing protein [Corynebacterium sp.]
MKRSIFTPLVVCAVAFGSFAVPQASAQLPDGAKINIDSVKVTNPEGDQPLRQWGIATFDVKWSAPEGVKAGQKFKVAYPPFFRMYNNDTFPLKGANGVNGGTCEVHSDTVPVDEATAHYILCTFDKTFENHDDVHGTLGSALQVDSELNDNKVDVVVEGDRKIKLQPTLPGGTGVGPQDRNQALNFQKFGWYTWDGKTAQWNINLPGQDLHGQTGPIEVTDQLTGEVPHKFKPGTLRMRASDCNPNGQLPGYCNLDNDEYVENVFTDETISADGRTLTFKLVPPAGGWRADKFYRMYYQSETADGNIAPAGDMNTKITSNHIRLSIGKDYESRVWREQRVDGTIEGVKRGSFEVTKDFNGTEEIRKKLKDANFTVKASYTLGGESKTEELTIPLGDTKAGSITLPRGTVVTLEEINLPTVDGVTFGTPKFAAADGEDTSKVKILDNGKRAEVTIRSENNVKVTLTNTANETPVLPGNPGSSSSSDNKWLWLLLLVPALAGIIGLLANVFKLPHFGNLIPGAKPAPKQEEQNVQGVAPGGKAIPKN